MVRFYCCRIVKGLEGLRHSRFILRNTEVWPKLQQRKRSIPLAQRATNLCRWRKPPDRGPSIPLARRAIQGYVLRIGDYFKHAHLMVSSCQILQTMTSRVIPSISGIDGIHVPPSGLKVFIVRCPVAYATGKDVSPSGLSDNCPTPDENLSFLPITNFAKTQFFLTQNKLATALPGGP